MKQSKSLAKFVFHDGTYILVGVTKRVTSQLIYADVTSIIRDFPLNTFDIKIVEGVESLPKFNLCPF